MKKEIYTLLLMLGSFSLFLISCQEQQKVSETVVKDEASGFTLITDTVTLDSKLLGIQSLDEKNGYELYSLAKHRGQYKLLFFNHSTDSIIISSLSADFRYKSTLKAAMPDSYPSSHLFFVRNDSLLLRIKNKVCQYIYFNCDSLTSRVIQLPTRLSNKDKYYHVECYQDEDYVIDYLDDGEFGQFVSFFAQKSDSSSCIMMPMHHIRRWHGAYYLISPCNIFQIVNPLEKFEVYEQEYRPGMTYRCMDCIERLSHRPRSEGGYYFEIMHLDNEPGLNTYIGAYVHNDQLYVLENRMEEGLSLKQLIEPDSLKEVIKISETPLSAYYAYNQPLEVMSPSNQLMLIGACNDNLPNFMEFSSDTIRKVILNFE